MVLLKSDIISDVANRRVKTLLADINIQHLRKEDGFAKTSEPSVFYIGEKYSSEFIFVEKGFWFDGLSVPWFLSWMIRPYGRYLNAGILHDKLYRDRSTFMLAQSDTSWITEILNRKECDDIFLEALLLLGCPKWKAKFAYRLIRMFGKRAWKINRKKDIGAMLLTSGE